MSCTDYDSVQSKQRLETANKDVNDIQVVPVGRTNKYIKKDAWEVPGLTKGKVVDTSNYVTTIEGRRFSVNVKSYAISEDILIEDPAKFLENLPESRSPSLGLLRVHAIKEFEINGRIFCYQVRFMRAGVDPITGKVGYGGGLFFYSYYDDDGDGKIESLVVRDVNNYNMKDDVAIFGGLGHFPTWVH